VRRIERRSDQNKIVVHHVVVTITKPVDEIAAPQAQRSSAMQNEPANRVFVFTEVRLKRPRTH